MTALLIRKKERHDEKTTLLLTTIAAAAVLSGCATIMEGNDQNVHFDTSPSGATCSISRSGEGVIYPSFRTPTSLSIEKDKDDLVISCQKEGCEQKTLTADSKFEGWTLGNLLIGGPIGVGIDAASGAMNSYPSNVVIPLNCTETGGGTNQPAAAPKEKSRVIICSDDQTCVVE